MHQNVKIFKLINLFKLLLENKIANQLITEKIVVRLCDNA